MILLVGSDEDNVIKYFSKFLEYRNKQYVFLNQKLLLRTIHLYDEYLVINKNKIFYKDFSGVLNRTSSSVTHDSKYISSTSFLLDLLDYKFPNILNKPINNISNDSKLYQLSQLSLKYIKYPESTVIAHNKIKLSRNNNIVKSLSSIRSIATRFEGNENLFLKKASEPTLFQRIIDGNNIRVHVIVDRYYPVKIISESLDYRYASDKMPIFKSYILPEEIGKECMLISEQLKLKFCGIDLIQNQNEYFILEANPSPAWSYFEENIDHQEMSKQLIRVLSNEQ